MQTNLAHWFLKSRYWLLCLAVIVLLGFRTDNTLWSGDFWEHSSVIRELATHPLNPVHPQLLANAPHAFFTPYHLTLGLLVRWMGNSPVEILARAGMFNLVLFLVGFYLFILSITRENQAGVAFYGLLFILLLWGEAVWNYSGFFHLRALGRIIPFPSMFAMGISLLSLAINSWRIKTGKEFWLLPILLLTEIVLLTHPLTFLFLATGLLAFSLRAHQSFLIDVLKISALLVLTIGLATLWPYYPFWQLVLGGSAFFHAGNQDIYVYVFTRVWPLLIGLPLFVYDSARYSWRQPLLWWFVILLIMYLLGWVSKAYSYGRVISYVGMLLQIMIAIYLALLEVKITQRSKYPASGQALFSLGIILIMVLLSYKGFISPVFLSALPQEEGRLERYYFLTQFTKQNEVILTSIESSLIVPTFGGKVVYFDRPQPFILDDDQRRRDVQSFFDETTSERERLDILSKYHVDYILLDRSDNPKWEMIRPRLAPFSKLIYRNQRFLLYKVDSML